MAVCTSCGQDNPEIARFCLACGLPLEQGQAPPREERRIVSVIFVDLVGFTSLAERLDPEDVQARLRPYHDAVRREIESFGGIVEKFIGDAVVGMFGAPVAYGDDAERAVRAAMTVRDTIETMDDADRRLELKVRIAVNTGEALVIVNARPALGEAMVTGDVVNTAARLQTAAPVGAVLVGEETYRATKDAVLYAPTPAVEAKGKEQPVPAWIALQPARLPGDRPTRGPLVGRRHELDVLRGTWERVASDRRPHLVTVIGPAGVGKTRLATEFAAMVRDRGGRTVRGRTLPYRESTAYSALAFQLKQLCGIFETDSADVASKKLDDSVSSLLPPAEAGEVTKHLAVILGLDPDGTITDRESLFFSIRSFIEAVAADKPTLLVFEDIHWADVALLDLVEQLAARLRDVPILVLSLARPELLDQRPGWGGGLLAHTALPLGPLDATDAAGLATHRLADGGATGSLDRAARLRDVPILVLSLARPELLDQRPGWGGGLLAHTALPLGPLDATDAAGLATHRLADGGATGSLDRAADLAAIADGNPLFIEQLAAAVAESGDSSAPLPTTVRGIIAARLDALPARERAVLLDASVSGRVFWRGMLERGADDAEALRSAIAELERRELISRQTISAFEGHQQYWFNHVLVRDVAYDLLPRAARRERHREAALFFEGIGSESGEVGAALARHWRDAGDSAKAVDYLVAAAEGAEHGWAKERAAALYREALQLVPEEERERRRQLTRSIALAETATYHVADARLLGRSD